VARLAIKVEQCSSVGNVDRQEKYIGVRMVTAVRVVITEK